MTHLLDRVRTRICRWCFRVTWQPGQVCLPCQRKGRGEEELT